MRAAVQAYATGQLTSSAEPASQPAGVVTSQPVPASQPASQATAIAITADSEPSPGTACAGPGCWQRNTTRFGLSRVPCAPPAGPPSKDATTSARSRKPQRAPSATAPADPPHLTRCTAYANIRGWLSANHPTSSRIKTTPRSSSPP